VEKGHSTNFNSYFYRNFEDYYLVQVREVYEGILVKGNWSARKVAFLLIKTLFESLLKSTKNVSHVCKIISSQFSRAHGVLPFTSLVILTLLQQNSLHANPVPAEYIRRDRVPHPDSLFKLRARSYHGMSALRA
jgi:hypothetical protein